ncbi:MAG: FAD-binding oxidoreductase [Candidatus Thorarchaeota archaeon]
MDTVWSGIFLVGIGTIGLFWIIPTFFVRVSLDPIYNAISIVLISLGVAGIVVYYFLYKNERTQILGGLISLRDSGLKVFLERYEVLLYGRDAGELPRISGLAFNHKALAIVQPANLEELRRIIVFCNKFRIPIIPRASGTSGYGGVIPIVSGVIVSLREFNRILMINKEEKAVEVESGVVWARMIHKLEQEGLTLECYPSSSLSSMVGGWIAQGGYGIGSSKYGNIKNSVLSVTLIDSKGEEVIFHEPEDVVGSYGTLGFILRIKLKVLTKDNMNHLAFTAKQETVLFQAAQAFQSLSPYFLRYVDQRNLKPLSQSQFGFIPEDHKPLGGGILSITFRGENENPARIEEIVQNYNLVQLSEAWATELWKDRFYTLRMKRRGPSLIIAEVNVPTHALVEFLESLNRQFGPNRFTKEFITNMGDQTTVMLWFLEDIRKAILPRLGSLTYMFRSLRPYIVFQIARSFGGQAYSTGLWFSPYSKSVLGPSLARFSDLKKQLDPYRLFNPGKIWAPYFPRFFPIIPFSVVVRLFIPILSFLHRILPQKLKRAIF